MDRAIPEFASLPWPSFQTTVTYASGGFLAWSIAVADVNGDGKPDLLVSNFCASSSNCGNGEVGVLLGNGNGTFQAAVTYSSGGNGGQSVAVADVNGDSKPDLVVINEVCSNCENGGSVGVLLGNGDGTFQTAVTYASGGYLPVSAAVTDVNGDGKPDLVAANFCASYYDNCYASGGVVGVLINITPSPYKAFLQPPINADGSSIFKANRGVIPVKFTLAKNSTPTCDLPPAAISVTRTAGATLGAIDEAAYLSSADVGSNFRIDARACQYIYNLAANALGVGVYRVDISINRSVVGSGSFALK